MMLVHSIINWWMGKRKETLYCYCYSTRLIMKYYFPAPTSSTLNAPFPEIPLLTILVVYSAIYLHILKWQAYITLSLIFHFKCYLLTSCLGRWGFGFTVASCPIPPPLIIVISKLLKNSISAFALLWPCKYYRWHFYVLFGFSWS